MLLFYVLATRHVGILAPRPGIELSAPALEAEASIPGLPGKSPSHSFREHVSLEGEGELTGRSRNNLEESMLQQISKADTSESDKMEANY